jgi:uncharacterized protein YecE (DUF72 family)
MEFGRVPATQLDEIDFSLPAEPAFNQKVLRGKPYQHPEVRVGCAKWGRKEWVGKLYPKGTKEAQFLDQYVKHYNSIELNATHYQVYGPAQIMKWGEKAAGRDFKFSPKIVNSISHYSSLENMDGLTTAFLEGILAFGDHLGPIFMQMSDRYSPKQKDKLFRYLESLPTDLQFFLEVRHPDWFTEPESTELFTFLRDHKIGAVITDTAGRRDCAHMHLTLPKTFIRYVGNSLHPSDYTRIDAWVDRMAYWLEQGIKEIHFFMHMHDEALSPELTVYLVDKLNAHCGLKLPKPQMLNGPTLFD